MKKKNRLRIAGILLGAAAVFSTAMCSWARIEKPEAGSYIIASAVDPNKTIRPVNSGTEEGTQYEIWDITGISEDLYKVEFQLAGFFEIINGVSDKALQVKDNSSESGSILQQNTLDYNDGQKWLLIPNGDGTYLIQSVLGMVLECVDDRVENGSLIRLGIEDGSDSEKWVLFWNGVNSKDQVRDGQYTIAAGLDYKKVLCVNGGSTDEGSQVVIWDDDQKENELFSIERQEEGFYKITSAESGMSLSVLDASADSGAQLVMKTYDGSPAQQWKITVNKKGRFLIQSALGTYLECTMSDTTNGNQVLLWQLNDLPSQEWILLPEGEAVGNIPELAAEPSAEEETKAAE